MSDRIDEPIKTDKADRVEDSSLSVAEEAVENGLVNKSSDGTPDFNEATVKSAKPVSRRNSRKSITKESDIAENMTNKVASPPLHRTRMRSRSKSSNSEDSKPKSEDSDNLKPKSVDSDNSRPKSVDSDNLKPKSVDSDNLQPKSEDSEDSKPVKDEDMEEPLTADSLVKSSAESPSLSDPTAEKPVDCLPESDTAEAPVVKMEEDTGETNKGSPDVHRTPKPEPEPEPISTPMIVDDDNSSDCFGFDVTEDKYAAFSVVLRPYEEVPVKIKSKKGSQNGPVNIVSKTISITPRTPVVRSSPSNRIDINDADFRKPFEFGWRRELVFRSTNENSMRRNADVYYYTPSNKKVRSLREVLEHLIPGEGLTADNFTFCKEPLGVNDSEKEIIREAYWKPVKGSDEGLPVAALPVKKTPKAKGAKPKEKKDLFKEDFELSQSLSPSTSSGSPLTPRIVMKTTTGVKLNSKRITLKVEKRRKAAGPDDSSSLDTIEEWCTEPKAQTNGLKRGNSDAGSNSDGSPPAKMAAISPKSTPSVKAVGVPKPAPKVPPAPKQGGAKSPAQAQSSSTAHPAPVPMYHTTDFMNLFNAGYIGLLHAFQYLKVHELLRAACVCKMWRHMATHRSLWETVKMKNSRVRNWEGFGRSLRSNGTKCLDLKKMLVPERSDAVTEMWKNLVEALKTVPTLTKIDMGRCSPDNLEMVAKGCPQLESIVALSIRGQSLDLKMFKGEKLTELKLKSVGGMDLSNFSALKSLTNLTHLSLTSVRVLNGLENALPPSLISLELGECCQISESFASETLPKLKNLTRLRLEKGQGQLCPTIPLINAISGLEKLSQLELINFDIKPGFDKALAKCAHVKTLLIIPTYVTQSATTNHVVMGGVTKLAATLEYFIWGLTLELLRVTDLFIDQVEGQKQKVAQTKKGAGDSIPILKPLSDENAEPSREGQTTSQVDILSLPKLQRALSTLLPNTKIKILKVPFSATWRQTIH